MARTHFTTQLNAMPFTLLAMKRRERRQLGGFSLAEYLAKAGWQPALPDRDKMPLLSICHSLK
jgi:hypothetical protein